MATVSLPLKVEVEIEDLTNGCTYRYQGAKAEDCVEYFLSLFLGYRRHKILYVRNISK